MNAPLLAGGLILLILMSVMIYPVAYTKYNPYATETLKSYQDESGNFKFMTPPFPPDERHVLGTDEMGRDVVSLIIYGARLTIGISIIVVLFRFAISFVIGISAAFGNPLAQGSIRLSNIIFNFVPPLIICLIILKIRFFESLPKTLSFWMFVFMLTLVGWARVAEIVQSRSEDILKQDFIRGEISIGKSRGMIAITNVVPHLAAEMTVMAFMEIAVVLGLLMQLGAFTVFIGNLRIVENSDRGIIVSKPMSFEPEWAAMMGASKTYLRSAPWLVFSPAVAFFVSILGFNMFGEGLRKALQAQNSKFMTMIKKRYKPVLALLSILILVVLVSQNVTASTKLDLPESMPTWDRVRQGDEAMADWLQERMTALGMKALKESYQHTYKFDPYWIVDDAELIINKTVLRFGKEFAVASGVQADFEGPLVDGQLLDLIGFESPDLHNNEILLLDGRYYQESMVREYIKQIEMDNTLGAVIVKMSSVESYQSIGTFVSKQPVIYISEAHEWHKNELVQGFTHTVDISGQGINVLGMLEGKEDKVNDEAIIIGVEYNYENESDMQGLKSALELMEAIAIENENLDRKVIFAFWDGNHVSNGYGVHAYLKRPLYAPKDTAAYIDLSVKSSIGHVVLDDVHAPHTRFYGWSLSQRAQKIGKKVQLEFTGDLSQTRPDLITRGPSSLHIQLTESVNEGKNTVNVEAFTGFVYDLIMGGAY